MGLDSAFRLYRGSTVLQEGKLPSAVKIGQWYNVSLAVRGWHFTATFNGHVVLNTTDASPATNLTRGFVALGTGWHTAQFDNFLVEPV